MGNYTDMDNFNDIIWTRYQQLRLKVQWLELRYFSLLFIIILQSITYVVIYFRYFK